MMNIPIILKYFLLFILILTISFVIANVLLFSSATEAIDSLKNLKQGTSNGKNFDLAVLVYAIALGILGIFNMYNSLEVFKKKEQIDKDMREILKNAQEIVKDAQNKIHEVQTKTLEMNLDCGNIHAEIKEFMINAKNELHSISQQVSDQCDNQMKKLDSTKDDVMKAIDEAHLELDSFRKTIVKDYNKHYYTYNLYSLIPDYLIDVKNRVLVGSAMNWFSQCGDITDLQMLIERSDKIPEGDHELKDICESAIQVLTRSLSNNDKL